MRCCYNCVTCQKTQFKTALGACAPNVCNLLLVSTKSLSPVYYWSILYQNSKRSVKEQKVSSAAAS